MSPRLLFTSALALALLAVACQAEPRPGTVENLGGASSVSVSVSGVPSEPGVVEPKPAGATQVNVTLREWAVQPETTRVKAGSIYFLVDNQGPDDSHNLVIIKTDLAPGDLPVAEGSVPADKVTIVGEIEPFAASSKASGVFNLTPGKYALICNIAEIEGGWLESHYQLGMWVAFTVTP